MQQAQEVLHRTSPTISPTMETVLLLRSYLVVIVRHLLIVCSLFVAFSSAIGLFLSLSFSFSFLCQRIHEYHEWCFQPAQRNY